MIENQGTEVRVSLVQPDGTRYVLPRTRIREAARVEKRAGAVMPPSGDQGFVTGDRKWRPFRFVVSFVITGEGADPINDTHDLLYELRTKVENCVAVIRKANTGQPITDGGGTPITDSDGHEISASRGFGIPVLAAVSREVGLYGEDERHRAVEVEFISKFGEATDGVPDDVAAYLAYPKIL